jgi:cation diffusion facilitator CzcD-associated flavoprotein CzcO
VAEAKWDESAQKWSVSTENGETFVANFVIKGAGLLNVLSETNFKGISIGSKEQYEQVRHFGLL